jgi:Uma2 family endonuclease
MAPAAANHSVLASRLNSWVGWHFEEKRRKNRNDNDNWIIVIEAWTDYNNDSTFVHDIAGFSQKDLPKLPQKGAIKATPLWVCEIVSPSNWSHDTQRKRVVLEKNGVPFYWLVDPNQKSIQVFELKSGAEHYQIIRSVDEGDGVVRLPPFKDLDLDLVTIFDYV